MTFKARATALYAAFCEQAASAAIESRVPEPAAYEALRHELRQLLLRRQGESDSRHALWRVRVRLYNAHMLTEPYADTDPDLPVEAPGVTVLKGLSEVAAWLTELAISYHQGQTVEGLDPLTLAHRLKSLRPTLSRRGGNAVWRVPYTTMTIGSDADNPRHQWIARVDVEKV